MSRMHIRSMAAQSPGPCASTSSSSRGPGLAARAPYPPVIDRMNAERADNLHSTSPRVAPPHVVQQGGGAARRGRHGPRASLSAVGAAPAVAQRKLDPGAFQASEGIIQRQIFHDPAKVEDDHGRAGLVEVENLRGEEYGPGANSPSVAPIGWNELKDAGHTLANGLPHNSHYNAVRMHLWNGRLGGPGGDVRNLAPGPAQVNSAMSAGPETGAKILVEAGKAIWLSTKVTYQTNTVNASDLTSVIPNHIHMEFGPMDSAPSGAVRGPGVAWDTDIDQPVGALTGDKQKQYKDVVEWSALDMLLHDASKQEKAQAYGLVPDPLKVPLILKHPKVYQGLGDPEKTAALGAMTAHQVGQLIVALGLHTSATPPVLLVGGTVENVLAYIEAPQLSDVFALLSGPDQIAVATYRKGAILGKLGQTGRNLARTRSDVFSLYKPRGTAGVPNDQFAILGMMARDEIQTLLGDSFGVKLFDGWAQAAGKVSLEDKEHWISDRVPERMAQRYKRLHEWAYRERASEERRAADPRPRRFAPY